MSVALDSALPGVAAQITAATDERQRSAALAAARMAATRSGLHEKRVESGHVAAQALRLGESKERTELGLLTDELDEIAWRLQERVDAQQANEAEYLVAFRRARAAAALFSALDAQPLKAALDSLYEAHHAIGDEQALRALIDEVLRGEAAL